MKLVPLILALFSLAPIVLAQNGTGWTLVWSDEFSQPDGSPPDSTKWNYDIGANGWGNNEWQYYTSRTNNARVEGGQLIIDAIKENYSSANYTSARLKTQGKWSWRYARIEARIKVPRGQGIWPAFWMLGTNITSVSWPNCGEIDILENIGKEPTNVYGTVHGPGYSGSGGIGRSFSLSNNAPFADDFHLYAIEWTTNSIRWFVDGNQFFSLSPASLPNGSTWVFNQPQFLLLNLAVGGNWPGYPDASTEFPQRLIVDYIRVYAPTNLTPVSTNALLNPGFETGGLNTWTTYSEGFNTHIQRVNAGPVRSATNSVKVFGRFNGAENFSGAYVEVPAAPGDVFRANGWVITLPEDRVAGANQAWIEVSFRDAGANIRRLFRSAPVDSTSPAGAWLNLAVTNQIDPANGAFIASVTNLVTSNDTAFVRYQLVFRQTGNAAGAVYFDDLRLTKGPIVEVPVSAAIAQANDALELRFNTFLDLPYLVTWRANLTESAWQPLTTVVGNGSAMTLEPELENSSGFFRVVRRLD